MLEGEQNATSMEGKESPKSCQIWKSKDGTLGNSLLAIVTKNSQNNIKN